MASPVITVGGFLLTLMMFSAVMVSNQSILDNTVNPLSDRLNDVVGSLKPQEITIEGGDPEQILEGAVVFNMMSSSNCVLITPLDVAVYEGWEVDSFEQLNSIDDPEKTRYAWFSGFETAEQEAGLNTECQVTTSSSILDTIRDAQDAISAGGGAAGQGASFVLNSGGVLAGAGAASLTMNPMAIAMTARQTAEATQSAYNAGQKLGEMLDAIGPENIAEETGLDMEGSTGKIRFEVGQTFVVGDEAGEEKILAYRAGRFNGIGPDFWQGKRASFYVPPGIQPGSTKKLLNEENLDSPDALGDREEFYSYRVRMKNVPRVVTSNDIETRQQFIRNIDYVFCKGGKGYIQSNARAIDDSGEAMQENPAVEDAVFPVVKITEQGDCLSGFSVDSWAGFRRYPDSWDIRDDRPQQCSFDSSNIGGSQNEAPFYLGQDSEAPVTCGVSPPRTLDQLEIQDLALPSDWEVNSEFRRSGWFSTVSCPSSPQSYNIEEFISDRTVTAGNPVRIDLYQYSDAARLKVKLEKRAGNTGMVIASSERAVTDSISGSEGIETINEVWRVRELNQIDDINVGNGFAAVIDFPTLGEIAAEEKQVWNRQLNILTDECSGTAAADYCGSVQKTIADSLGGLEDSDFNPVDRLNSIGDAGLKDTYMVGRAQAELAKKTLEGDKSLDEGEQVVFTFERGPDGYWKVKVPGHGSEQTGRGRLEGHTVYLTLIEGYDGAEYRVNEIEVEGKPRWCEDGLG